MNEIIMWLIVCVALIVIECVTMGLTTIWFAIGSLGAMIVAMCGLPVWLQMVMFVIVSVITLIFTRPLVAKYFNKNREKTNVEAIIGKEGIVVVSIDNLQALGTVTVGGQEWTARASDSAVKIPAGSVVVVKAIEGVKLIVAEREEGK